LIPAIPAPKVLHIYSLFTAETGPVTSKESPPYRFRVSQLIDVPRLESKYNPRISWFELEEFSQVIFDLEPPINRSLGMQSFPKGYTTW